jgi:hypothetical protein
MKTAQAHNAQLIGDIKILAPIWPDINWRGLEFKDFLMRVLPPYPRRFLSISQHVI